MFQTSHPITKLSPPISALATSEIPDDKMTWWEEVKEKKKEANGVINSNNNPQNFKALKTELRNLR